MTTQEVDDLRKELADLKSLVNRFLDSIYDVPFRAVDCDQNLVGSLWKELSEICLSEWKRDLSNE